jgi:hypothetical protein
MKKKYEAGQWAETYCTRCTAGWKRTISTEQDERLLIVCKLDMATVPKTLTSCDNFEDREEPVRKR